MSSSPPASPTPREPMPTPPRALDLANQMGTVGVAPLFSAPPLFNPTGLAPFVVSRPNQKERCTRASCYHVRMKSCTKCKPCCMKAAGTCQFKGHNGGLRPMTMSSDPAHLPRPIPSVPLLFPLTTTVLEPSPQPVPIMTAEQQQNSSHFLFKKPVSSALLEDNVCRHAERNTRTVQELSRMENERRIKHSVVLVVYFEENKGPSLVPLQDIRTWPTLNLSQISTLSALLNVASLKELELFVEKFDCWTTLGFAMSVKTDDRIILRKKGLNVLGPTCSSILVVSPPSHCTSPDPSSPKMPSLKRRASSPPLSPMASPSKPRWIHTEVIEINHDHDDHDNVWELGSVYTPPEA